MDEKYYRFWSEFFRQAAEGRARFDMMRSMMEQVVQGRGDFFELFRKWFDMPGKGSGASESNDPITEFSRMVNRFMSDFGVVPLGVYKDMEEKCNALKQRVEEQEETIRRLRRMVGEKETGGTESSDWFNEMMSSQQQQFRKWTQMFMPAASPEDESKEEKK